MCGQRRHTLCMHYNVHMHRHHTQHTNTPCVGWCSMIRKHGAAIPPPPAAAAVRLRILPQSSPCTPPLPLYTISLLFGWVLVLCCWCAGGRCIEATHVRDCSVGDATSCCCRASVCGFVLLCVYVVVHVCCCAWMYSCMHLQPIPSTTHTYVIVQSHDGWQLWSIHPPHAHHMMKSQGQTVDRSTG